VADHGEIGCLRYKIAVSAATFRRSPSPSLSHSERPDLGTINTVAMPTGRLAANRTSGSPPSDSHRPIYHQVGLVPDRVMNPADAPTITQTT